MSFFIAFQFSFSFCITFSHQKDTLTYSVNILHMSNIIKSVPHKYFSTNDDFHDFIETQKEWMYARIVESIELAFINDYDQAPILLATIEDRNNVITINSEYDDWIRSLQLALNWYKNLECYEECGRIYKLINEIKDENRI